MYLLDTDILIDHLRGHRSLEDVARACACTVDDFCVSLITVVELYAGKHGTQNVDELLKDFPTIFISHDIAKRAGELRRQYGLGIGDAIVSATVLLEHIAVVTRNLRHFSLVKGIETRTP